MSSGASRRLLRTGHCDQRRRGDPRLRLATSPRGWTAVAARERAAAEASERASDALTLDVLLEQWGSLRLADRLQPILHAPIPLSEAGGRPATCSILDRGRGARSTTSPGPADRHGRPDGRLRLRSRATIGGQRCSPSTSIRSPPRSSAARRRARPVLVGPRARHGLAAASGLSVGPYRRLCRSSTAQRRGEVAGTGSWSERRADCWSHPAARSRNGVAHVVPRPRARALKATPRRAGERLGFLARTDLQPARNAGLDEECLGPRLHDSRR